MLVLHDFTAAAEGRYFDGFRPDHNVHDLETPTDDAAAAENLSYLFRSGIGGDIEVFGLDTEQQIAYRPADHISLESFVVQAADDFFRRKTEHVLADTVCRKRDNFFVHRRFAAFAGQNFVQPFFQHILILPSRPPETRNFCTTA